MSEVAKATGNQETILINNDDSERLSKEKIEKMLKESKELEEQQMLTNEKIDSKNSLKKYIHSMKKTIEDKE